MTDPDIPRRINAAGLDLIKSFEKCRLAAYDTDGAGIWTIGWGHTPARPGQRITQAQADALFASDLAVREAAVTDLVRGYPTTDNQYAALFSLGYNIGMDGLAHSSALRLHRAGKHSAAANAFRMWVKARGKTLAGLVRRREAERTLYLTA